MPLSTIRDVIATYISENNITINKFAERSGIHSATLTRIIKGQQAFNMGHLDKVTATLGLEKDYFYDSYVDECLYLFAPTWRRIRPFIQRCAEAGRVDCIRQLVEGLLDDLAYASMLFELAEELFDQKYWKAAAVLYENVALSERLQNSERLALCKFRLFTISIGDDRERNFIEAALFEPYAERLDEFNRLDALESLVHVYASLHDWDKVDTLAQEILHLATTLYEMQYRSDGRTNSPRKDSKGPRKPLYRYILYANLSRSTAFEEKGDYTTALSLVQHYTDARWIKENNQEAKRVITQFQEWGKANTYLYRVLDGQRDVVEEYAEYVSAKENEIFIALFRILESANRYHWDVDHIIERFSSSIPYHEHIDPFTKRNKQVYDDYYTRFQNELAKYYLTHKHIEKSDINISGTDLSATFDPERNIIKGKLSVEFEVEF
ncbi:helix-turn-helix domain-containing protein [Paenibacillus tengchongensis]|uniref:helix-turn-helix domain-containing protein n=1 Tax=Paenibacillus tengchongensis TaxID=2608684 RepID=UPI001651DCEE|nr:helix-turn-helix transcriptional regulator [Paenibacillus tengchongensis]